MASFVAMLPGDIAQGLIWGIMALGVYITFRILNFADMTVDGTFALGGAVTVMLTISGMPIGLALIIATLTGVLAGLSTGFLHICLGIPDILAGILVQMALYSVNLNIMKASNKALSVDKYVLLVSLRYIVPTIITSLIFVAVVIAVMYWYFGTAQGSAIRATGNNMNMARAQGINIGTMKVIGLALSNGLVALSGGLIAQYQGFADINMGRGSIVIGLAAVIIGEVLGNAIFGKKMNFALRMIFVVLGAIIYYIVIGIVLWLRFPSEDLKLFTTVIVAIFMAVPYLRERAVNSYSKAGKKGGKS
ncbi:MAG: ABC transporter permease [Catonella sp.]|nr:ABC transporter permease [Catonella sp.]MDY6356642.1 ABC transporter permease [Catonella sp.]